MVLTGIQPPDRFLQKSTNSTRSGISKSIPIPAGGRTALTSHCVIPQDQNSPFSLSGLHNDSPHRSAGSFINMVDHPLRKAPMPTKLMGNHPFTSYTNKVDDHHDENDMLTFMCSNSGRHPLDVTTPSSSSSSSVLLPSIINASSWEDQPYLLHSDDDLQSSGLMELSKLQVVAPPMICSAHGSVVTWVCSADHSMSAASSSQLQLGPELQHSEELEKVMSTEEEYGSLACCLEGGFWAHPNGTLCACEDSLPKHEEQSMQIDDLIFDIPNISHLPSVPNSSTAHNQLPQVVADQAPGYHSECQVSSFCSSSDLLAGEGSEAADGVFGSSLSSQPNKPQLAPKCSDSILQAADELLDHGDAQNPAIDGGRPLLVRSCSLSVMPPTSSLVKELTVDHSPPSLLRTSSLGNMGILVQSRKRSLSASELNSEGDCHSGLVINCGKDSHTGSGSTARLQAQMQAQLHSGLAKRAQPMILQRRQGTLMQTAGKKDHNQRGITNTTVFMQKHVMIDKERSLLKSSSHEDMCRRVMKAGSACKISQAINYKQMPGINSNFEQRQVHIKQGRRRHGTATDPQSIAARTRREKFSERIRMLQSLVPNGERLDTVSMLGQTLEYIRFLQHQVWELCHGKESSASSALSAKTCDKWKHFMDTPSSCEASSATAS